MWMTRSVTSGIARSTVMYALRSRRLSPSEQAEQQLGGFPARAPQHLDGGVHERGVEQVLGDLREHLARQCALEHDAVAVARRPLGERSSVVLDPSGGLLAA